MTFPQDSDRPLQEDEVAQRLDFLELDPDGLARVRALAPVLEPQVPGFVDRFYEHLSRFPSLSRLLAGRIEGLKQTQARYFRELVGAKVDWGYVEGRLRVGSVHDQVGLPPDWYLSSFCRYVLGVTDGLRARLQANDDEAWEGFQALIKLIFFDMGLAVDAYISARERRLESQQRALRELSAPVIEVWRDIIVLPLVGTMDTHRAQEVTEGLLNGVDQRQAKVAIIDITGLPVMDTSTANHLITAVRAVELLGATVIVTGLRPAIAQTIVSLGIDTSHLRTKARLADGLRLALELTGRQVIDDGQGEERPGRRAEGRSE
ncbi:MAG: protoglobin domain-containing protein [Planctomycetota bacterium]